VKSESVATIATVATKAQQQHGQKLVGTAKKKYGEKKLGKLWQQIWGRVSKVEACEL